MTKRVSVFIFGIVTYLIFVLTVLYAIGFVANIVVPNSVDRGEQSPVLTALLINLALMSVFVIQHTIMARRPFKEWLARWLPEPAVRSVYVLCASLSLLVLFWGWHPIPQVIWSVPDGLLNLLLSLVFWFGWAAILLSTFLISHFDLFGLRQVYFYLRGRDYTPVPFKQSTVYQYIRHPLMLSFLIAFWATPQMSVGHLLFALAMTVYILVGIAFEERDLRRVYGQPYENYRQQVSMLFPLPGKKKLP